MHYFIIDTETTGLPKDGKWPKPISIALIHACIITTTTSNSELDIYLEKEWYITTWVDELSEDTSTFLGITQKDIHQRGIPFGQVQLEINSYLNQFKNKTFVAHNSRFDMNVLASVGLDFTQEKWYCTMLNGMKYCKLYKYPKLIELAIHFNIKIEPKKLHSALYDALVCAHVFFCLETKCYTTKLQEFRILELRNRNIVFTCI